ncbi:MAG: acyltransferase [Burkholderiales bacterium]|nr:acyltransferase [Burkholderiales bacterium]
MAAIAVILGHASIWMQPVPTPRAWLAVDLFFALSGFVICHVYENRLDSGMTVSQFMKLRYIRLYPLFVVGVGVGIISGAAALVLGKGHLSSGGLALAAISGLLMLPSPTWNLTADLIPLNKPGWSLFFECFINLIYAAYWRQLNKRLLIGIIVLSGGLLAFYCTMGQGYGGTSWSNFFWGFPRVSFSFFFGVLIAKNYDGKCTETGLAWLLPLLLIPILFSVNLSGPYIEFLMVILVFPATIAIGARIEPPKQKLFLLLSAISYPVYAIHEPILYLLWRIFIYFNIKPEEYTPEIGIAFVVCMLIICTFLEKFYDRPVRRYLTALLLGNKSPQEKTLKGNS